MLNVEFARRQMIEQQVRAWEVLDLKVLDVLSHVRREDFVPPTLQDLAFADTSVPLPHGQSMLPPKLEGRILQSLEVTPDDRVLEVGTGSGFFATCLGRLGRTVRSIDIFPDLVEEAREKLRAAGAHNVTVETADAMQLDVRDAYDAIALTGSLPIYDPRFEQALAVGGRLFVVVGTGPMMEARLITRVGVDEWRRQSLFETAMDPLIHAATPPKFVF
jgi:protein-L-isoaspartate(D-aspartate) O-methyltransferase